MSENETPVADAPVNLVQDPPAEPETTNEADATPVPDAPIAENVTGEDPNHPTTTVPTPEEDSRTAWEEDIKDLTRENAFIFNEAMNASLAYVGRLLEAEGHPFDLDENMQDQYDSLDPKEQALIRRRFYRQTALTQSPFALEMARSIYDGVKKDLNAPVDPDLIDIDPDDELPAPE